MIFIYRREDRVPPRTTPLKGVEPIYALSVETLQEAIEHIVATAGSLSGLDLTGGVCPSNKVFMDGGEEPLRLPVNGLDLSHTALTGRRLSGCLENTSFDYAELTGLTFNQCDFTGSSFYKAKLTRCSFNSCNLVGVSFEEAHLEWTSLYAPNWSGADTRFMFPEEQNKLRSKLYTGVEDKFRGATLVNCRIDSLSVPEAYTTLAEYVRNQDLITFTYPWRRLPGKIIRRALETYSLFAGVFFLGLGLLLGVFTIPHGHVSSETSLRVFFWIQCVLGYATYSTIYDESETLGYTIQRIAGRPMWHRQVGNKDLNRILGLLPFLILCPILQKLLGSTALTAYAWVGGSGPPVMLGFALFCMMWRRLFRRTKKAS